MSKNIRITEPSAEMLSKIIRAREAIAAQKPRYIKCHTASITQSSYMRTQEVMSKQSAKSAEKSPSLMF